VVARRALAYIDRQGVTVVQDAIGRWGVRPITTATIMMLALSACSRTGTLEGDIYVVTHDGEVKRGTGARVYLVPEDADQSLFAAADTLCTQARHWQEYSNGKRRASIEDHRRFFEKQADSLRQEAEGLPAAQRVQQMRSADALLGAILARTDSMRLAAASDPFSGATRWLGEKLRLFYAGASVNSASTDVDGHYVLDDVPRGTYALVALTERRLPGIDLLGWHTRVEVSSGLRRQHLDNHAKLYLHMLCPPDEAEVPAADSM